MIARSTPPLLEIAELDDSYAEGNIGQEEYLKVRQGKKQQVINLSREKDASD
jgi:hypothetical protein